jgi:type IX secretion system substrate protein
MKYFGLLISSILLTLNVMAQFPPPTGQEGSTAIHKDSTVFVNWAKDCVVERGYLDISQPEMGFANLGEESNALGIADNNVVSLGDGGSAVLSFDPPLANGDGPDFAVFENAFLDDFLELAFVEVSSDGINFFRFDAFSLSQTEIQTEAFGLTDARQIRNLAGKYVMLYGTPFDLEELKDLSGLNVNKVTHVRIVDVVGCLLDEFVSYDSEGRKINDPWPTPFPSGGFDLDAVGVIHNTSNTAIAENEIELIRVYPMPAKDFIWIDLDEKLNVVSCKITDTKGLAVLESDFSSGMEAKKINIQKLQPGLYFLNIVFKEWKVTKKLLVI